MDESTVTTKTYAGRIRIADHGDSDDVLFVGDAPEPLAEIIESDIDDHGRYLSVSYWITDEPCARDEIQEAWLRNHDRVRERVPLRFFGGSTVEFYARYSDITGYLWTDEEITIGGHDLLAELRTADGKCVCLEISYSPTPRS